MNRLRNFLPVAVVLAAAAWVVGEQSNDKPNVAKPTYRSPVAVVSTASGSAVWVAENTGQAVTEVDLESGKVNRRISLGLPPSGLALDAARDLLYVTGEAPEGRVFVVNLKTGQEQASLPTGHTPIAPVLSGDGNTLYVCNRFNNNIGVFDTKAAREVAVIPVDREPIAAALTPDGKCLVVANHLPNMPANKDLVAAKISLIDTADRKVVAQFLLSNGSTSVRGLCIAPDGKYAYISHALAHFQFPTTQLERGWMNTSAVSILDLATKRLLTTVLLDDVDLGAANPWGLAVSADGGWLYIAHAGTHEVSAINRTALHEKLDAVAAGKPRGVSNKLEDVPSDLAFLVGIRQRIKLPGNGPRGLALAGSRIVTTQFFTDDLAVIRRTEANHSLPQAISLGSAVPVNQTRKGEMLWNDAQLCFQHWQSCASCHPDARVDGLNWDLLNDGIGNPKNSRNMVLVHKQNPVMSIGERESAEDAVRAGLKTILFSVRPEEDAAAIDSYLKSLTPVPSPKLVKGKLSPAAERGKQLFASTGCAVCHPAPVFTDNKSHDLHTGTGLDKGKPFITTRLVEVWRTGPYLHDGRAQTVQEAITLHDTRAANLNRQDLDDLAEYVLSN